MRSCYDFQTIVKANHSSRIFRVTFQRAAVGTILVLWGGNFTPTYSKVLTYTALSLVFSTNEVCVKTQQKHCCIKHHDKTKQY